MLTEHRQSDIWSFLNFRLVCLEACRRMGCKKNADYQDRTSLGSEFLPFAFINRSRNAKAAEYPQLAISTPEWSTRAKQKWKQTKIPHSRWKSHNRRLLFQIHNVHSLWFLGPTCMMNWWCICAHWAYDLIKWDYLKIKQQREMQICMCAQSCLSLAMGCNGNYSFYGLNIR